MLAVDADHVHIFISFSPKYSISKGSRDSEGSKCARDTEGVSKSEVSGSLDRITAGGNGIR